MTYQQRYDAIHNANPNLSSSQIVSMLRTFGFTAPSGWTPPTYGGGTTPTQPPQQQPSPQQTPVTVQGAYGSYQPITPGYSWGGGVTTQAETPIPQRPTQGSVGGYSLPSYQYFAQNYKTFNPKATSTQINTAFKQVNLEKIKGLGATEKDRYLRQLANENPELADEIKGQLSYTYVPPTTPPGSLGEITTTGGVNLPSTTYPQGNITGAVGAVAGAGSANQSLLISLQNQLAAMQSQQQGLFQQFFGQGQQQSTADLRTQLNQQYNIQAKIAEIDALTGEYNKAYTAKEQQIAQSYGTLASMNFINNQVAQVNRNAAVVLNSLSANINSKAAILTMNQDLVNQAISDAVADRKYQLDMFKEFYNANNDSINRLSDIYKIALKEAMDISQKEYDDARDEKIDVANLMIDNPQAGITTNDSYQEAAIKVAKAGGSLAYQKEQRLQADEAGGVTFTKTEQKQYDAHLADLQSWGNKEDAMTSLNQNKSAVIGDVGLDGFNRLMNEVNKFPSKTTQTGLTPTAQAATTTPQTTRKLRDIFGINPFLPAGAITIKPIGTAINSFFNRLFGKRK